MASSSPGASTSSGSTVTFSFGASLHPSSVQTIGSCVVHDPGKSRPLVDRMDAVRVSTRGDYASRALLSLALRDELSAPTSVRDLAERTGLPQPYLEQILLEPEGRRARALQARRRAAATCSPDRPNPSPWPRSSRRSTARSSPETSASPTRTARATTRASASCSASGPTSGNHMREHLASFTLADMVMQARGGRPVARTHSALDR